ncbi:MAG: exopolyphosphatase [Lachnospiraceae bacterium]|nr:exopolyphosphatase [Lachnospiraceae bacterium]
MAVKTFAAIDVGSFELGMKIFEISPKGIRELDEVRHAIDLGSDTYATGKISFAKVGELCDLLKQYKSIMSSYQVSDYVAYGTSAIRETVNTGVLLDQIRQRTGLKIQILSNSEQRFLDYKSIAFKLENFEEIVADSAAILDIGGGSIQISLFEEGKLNTTRNLRLGILRVQDNLTRLNAGVDQVPSLVNEMVSDQLDVFKKMHLSRKKIRHMIVVDDQLTGLIQKEYGSSCAPNCGRFLRSLTALSSLEIARKYQMAEDAASLLRITAIMVLYLMDMMGIKSLQAPGVTLCDGIVYEYAEKKNKLLPTHDFEQDIISSAWNLSKRYMSSMKRDQTMETIALKLYDSMQSLHGLSKRERLLLQIAGILHDCGKFTSLVNVGECSYNIVMNTEIIGLSHRERELVANIVKYIYLPFAPYSEFGAGSSMDVDTYLVLSKLTAILRLAKALDRSHQQKFIDMDVKVKSGEQKLQIQVRTSQDITMEKGLLGYSADLFEEVYSVRPVIRKVKQ